MWSAQAETEGLTLVVAENTTGYLGVYLDKPGKPKPYLARVTRGGKSLHLGSFATAEEAALCVARSLEGQAAAQKAAAVLTHQPLLVPLRRPKPRPTIHAHRMKHAAVA